MKILLLLFNISILYASDFTLDSKDDTWTQIKLHGQNEVCNISIRDFPIHGNRIQIDSRTCVSMTNSKNKFIICTKKKTICKVEDEILNFIINTPTKNKSKQSNILITQKGTIFKSSVNTHGAILKSKSFTIYLGKSCDVSSPQLGDGIWEQNKNKNKNKNNFNIRFDNGKIVNFPHINAPIDKCLKNSKSEMNSNITNRKFTRVYFDDLSIFPMDYYNKYIEIECGIGETQVRYMKLGEVSRITDAFIVESYCKLRRDIKGNTHKKNPSRVQLFIINDSEGKTLARKIQYNPDKTFIFKGIFKKADYILTKEPTLFITDINITGKAPPTKFSDLFK